MKFWILSPQREEESTTIRSCETLYFFEPFTLGNIIKSFENLNSSLSWKTYSIFKKSNLPTRRFLKCLPILRGDEAVDDGIDGGVEVEEYAGDVHELFVCHKVGFFWDPVKTTRNFNLIPKEFSIG